MPCEILLLLHTRIDTFLPLTLLSLYLLPNIIPPGDTRTDKTYINCLKELEAIMLHLTGAVGEIVAGNSRSTLMICHKLFS